MANLDLRVLVDVVGGEKLNSLSGSMNSIGRNLTRNVTLPLVGVGAAATALAADAQKADAQLAQVFKTMKAGAFTTIPALEAQAEALANATQFDDEAIKEAQSVMLTFGQVTEESFDRAIVASTDMAAALDQDLQSTIIQVGKALNDPIKGMATLRRVGVQLTDQQTSMVAAFIEAGDVASAQGVILEELEHQFGGVAAAIGETDAGKFAQSMEEVGEAGESLGTILLPIVTKVAEFLKGLAEAFQALPSPVQGAIATFLAFAAAAGPLLIIGSKLAGGIQLLHAAFLHIPTVVGIAEAAFGKLAAGFRILTALLLSNPFIALAAAVVAIAALIILNWDKVVAFFKEVWRIVSAGFTALGETLSDIWNGITRTVNNLVQGVIAAWRTLMLMTEVIWNFIGDIIKGAINAVIGVINGFLGFLNGLSFGFPGFDGPFGIHIDGFTIDPFNIPTIPFLAEGGIITSPTLAMLGERGPEAVVPLDRADTLNRTVNIYVQGDIRDEEELLSLFERSERLNAAMAGG